ncbi:BspA family leucine-rich repeat surface protein [Bombilactobacillus thymidiniphilus]|uniref:DUF285 domain-containing protein n=1 Tax=Bombilactobacillus thymidiniphilus TaxID=2923363 RepID=A0ABY4PCZ0_9LACO|nr:BspA family leucine-rich repeat surface protein [Bombilactobacillus thymidiniphilus]UQS83142.1 DUF285 domain-containing protein [Bombilactobacillus thymidiniphilus]
MFSKKFIKILGSLLMTAFLCILVMSNVYNAVNASDMQQTIDFNQKLTSKTPVSTGDNDTSSPLTWKVTNNLDATTTTNVPDFSVNDPNDSTKWWYIKDNVLHIRNHQLNYSNDALSGVLNDPNAPIAIISRPWPWTKYAQYITSAVMEDTTTATSIPALFQNCINLRHVTGLDRLISSDITRLNSLFAGCKSLTDDDLNESIDFSKWDTSNVITVESMFEQCSSLTTIDLSDLNLSKVTSTSKMFSKDTSLQSVTLAPTMLAVAGCGRMFSYDDKLQKINFNDFNMPPDRSARQTDSPLTGCSSLWQFSVGPNAKININVVDVPGISGGQSYYTNLFPTRDRSAAPYELAAEDGGAWNWKEMGGKVGIPETDPTKANGVATLSPMLLIDDINSHNSNSVNSITGLPIWTYVWEPQWWTIDDQGTLHIAHHQLSDTDHQTFYWPWNSESSANIGAVQRVVIDDDVTVKGSSLNGFFQSMYNLTEIKGLQHLFNSNISSAESLFAGCKSLQTLDLTGLNSNGGAYTTSMLSGCTSLWHLHVNGKFNAKDAGLPSHTANQVFYDSDHPKYLLKAASANWREVKPSDNPNEPAGDKFSQDDVYKAMADGKDHDFVWDQNPGLLTMSAPTKFNFGSHFLLTSNSSQLHPLGTGSGDLKIVDTRYDRLDRDAVPNDVTMTASHPASADSFDLANHLFFRQSEDSPWQSLEKPIGLTDVDLNKTVAADQVSYSKTDLASLFQLQFLPNKYPKWGTYKTAITYTWNNTPH